MFLHLRNDNKLIDTWLRAFLSGFEICLKWVFSGLVLINFLSNGNDYILLGAILQKFWGLKRIQLKSGLETRNWKIEDIISIPELFFFPFGLLWILRSKSKLINFSILKLIWNKYVFEVEKCWWWKKTFKRNIFRFILSISHLYPN